MRNHARSTLVRCRTSPEQGQARRRHGPAGKLLAGQAGALIEQRRALPVEERLQHRALGTGQRPFRPLNVWGFPRHGANRDAPYRYYEENNPDADFEDLDTHDAPAVLAAFWEEVDAARAAVRGKSLDEQVPSHGHHRERVRDIRWLYLHMIEEYARHNGHADLIRERIDGVTGD